MQNRFKSKVLWAAVVAQVVTLLITFGVINTGLGTQVNDVVAIVLQLLVAIGVLNNPTDPTRL
jgi:phi LC3 family holin